MDPMGLSNPPWFRPSFFSGLDALIIAIGPDAAFSRANEVVALDFWCDPGKQPKSIMVEPMTDPWDWYLDVPGH